MSTFRIEREPDSDLPVEVRQQLSDVETYLGTFAVVTARLRLQTEAILDTVDTCTPMDQETLDRITAIDNALQGVLPVAYRQQG